MLQKHVLLFNTDALAWLVSPGVDWFRALRDAEDITTQFVNNACDACIAMHELHACCPQQRIS